MPALVDKKAWLARPQSKFGISHDSDCPSKSSPPTPLNFFIVQLSPTPSSSIYIQILSPPLLSDLHYLRLPELKELWDCKEFSGWNHEPLLKPALQGLEITFRFISTALSDPRPYANRREWKRRLESLARSQVEIIAMLCEDEAEDGVTRGAAPIVDLTSSYGTLARRNSSAEVWKLSDEVTVVSRTSEASLLPRLVTWRKSEDIAQNILDFIEAEMRKCPYTLGLGELNLNGKPSLDYDAIVKPAELHSLKKSPMNLQNFENQTLYTTHQILESWICASKSILNRIAERIESKSFGNAASDCWILEKTWNLLTEIENLHLLMDPDDFLRLKHQLSIKVTAESQPFCFRSRGLVEITKLSKDLRQKVPGILDVEVDPNGGPRVQEAAMKMYAEKDGFERIHLVQGLQAIEMGVKRFYYSYKQLLTVVMGSLEAGDSGDSLDQVFLEPTYFPSLDAAKTFLAVHRSHEHGRFSP
nr:nematode resistance protein-like HSPRO2 [Ipomoea batatas]